MQYAAGAKRPNFIIPKGEYPARITAVEEKTSKAGNPMLVVDLEVYDNDKTKGIRDYIVLGGEYSADWKLSHLAQAAGLPDDGNLDVATLCERNLRVKVKIKPAKGEYDESNVIDDYVKPVAGDVAAIGAAANAPQVPGARPQLDGDEPPFMRPFDLGI